MKGLHLSQEGYKTHSYENKISYAMCNNKMEPILLFSDLDSMIGHAKRQQELHGKAPSGTPCKIITTIEMEKLEWPIKLD